MSGSLCLPYFEERPEELRTALKSLKYCEELHISGLEWNGDDDDSEDETPQIRDWILKKVRITRRRFPNLRRLYVYGFIYDVDFMIRWKSLKRLTMFVDRREPEGGVCLAEFKESTSLKTIEADTIDWDIIPLSVRTVKTESVGMVYYGNTRGVENLILTNASDSDQFSEFTGLRTLTMDKLANPRVLLTVAPDTVVIILPADEIRVEVHREANGVLYLDGKRFFLDHVPGAEFPPLQPGLPGWLTLVSPARPMRRFRIGENRQIINLE